MDDPVPLQVESAAMLAGEGRALRALARSLLCHGDAEDVVQESYAAALAAPAAARRLGPWLTGTVRHLAKMLRRSETRRRSREQIAAREEIDPRSDPAVIAAQAEIIHNVAAAVRALDEPFRTVIVLRFWRGLLPEAISQRLGVPNNTVRSRLQRGLERLRVRLDAEHGDRERWSAPLLAFAGVEPAAAASAAAGGAFLVCVGLIMKTKLFVAAGAVLVAALGVPLLWNDRQDATAVAADQRGAAVQPVAEAVGQTPAATSEGTRVAVPAPAAIAPVAAAPFDASPMRVPPWLARLLVVDEDDRPVADATITIWAATRAPQLQQVLGKGNNYAGHARNALLELHTDPQGRASTMLEIECVMASASKDRARTGEVTLRHPRSSTVETKFVLEVPILLRGIVVRADGSPGASAKVISTAGHILEKGGFAPTPEPVVAGADGRFVVRVVRSTYCLHAELDGSRSFQERCSVHDEHPPEVLLVFPGAITLNGLVVDPDGRPVDQAKILFWREYHIDDPKQDSDDCETGSASTGTDGRFSIAVRKHARFQLLASADGHANSDPVWTETTAVRPHAETRLVLHRLATIAGVVQHADGSPFPGVTVLAVEGSPVFGSVVGPSWRERFGAVPAAKSAADGRFRLTVHPSTDWSIAAVARASPRSRVMKGVAPGSSDVAIVVSEEELAGCLVRGTVVLAANGQPVNSFEVAIVQCDDRGSPTWVEGDVKARIEGNRFELPPLALGRTIAIEVTPREAGKLRITSSPYPPTSLGPFTTSSAGIDLQFRIDAWGEQPVQVLAADGTPARRVRVNAICDANLGLSQWLRDLDAEGKVVMKQCTPGAYRLKVMKGRERLLELPATILPGPNPEIVLRLPAENPSGKGR